MAVGKGSGTTISYGAAPAAALVYKATDVSWDDYGVAEIGTGDLGAVIRTYEAGNILDYGTVTADLEWDGAVGLPVLGGDGTAQFILKIQGSAAAKHTWTTTAFWETLSAVIPNEDKMTGTAVFRLTGPFVQSP